MMKIIVGIEDNFGVELEPDGRDGVCCSDCGAEFELRQIMPEFA